MSHDDYDHDEEDTFFCSIVAPCNNHSWFSMYMLNKGKANSTNQAEVEAGKKRVG